MPLYASENGTALPRVDRIVEENGVQSVLPGVPTAGADLTNRTGAAALPENTKHVSYVLIPQNTLTLTPLPFRRDAG